MAKTIHFNTHRKYTEAGQRITATLHDDGMVTFWDHDRGIDGAFMLPTTNDDIVPMEFDARAVMTAYDHNVAQSCRRSWEDGMQRGGCNSKFVG